MLHPWSGIHNTGERSQSFVAPRLALGDGHGQLEFAQDQLKVDSALAGSVDAYVEMSGRVLFL